MLLTSYFHHQKGILVSLLLLYLSALTPPTTFLVGAEPNPHYCETENGNGTVCKTQVKITCRATVDGTELDCLNPDEQNTVPWLEIDAINCQTIPIKVEFKMCNMNENDRIQIIPETTRFMFMGEELIVDDKKQWIEPLSCRTKFIDRTVDTCRTPKQRPMSVLLNARMIRDETDPTNQGDNGHCFCYTYKKTTFKVNGTPNPIEPPVDPCVTKNYIITEIANPNPNAGKYIEIYNPECAGKVIQDPIEVIRYPYGSSNHVVVTNLQGLQIPSDGFLILCKNKQQTDNVYGQGTCNVEADIFPSSSSNTGKDSYAVYDFYGRIRIDLYGSKNADNNRNVQNISNGRAERKTEYLDPSSYWMPEIWNIIPGEGTGQISLSDLDPRTWTNFDPIQEPIDIIITEIIDTDDANGVPQRYVELYVTDLTLHGTKITSPYKLVIYPGSYTVPRFDTAFDLQGITIPSDGFIVVCNLRASTLLPGKCDFVHDVFYGPTNSDGNDQIAIILGGENYYDNMDVFGDIGTDGFGTDHDFEDARVVRKLGYITPNQGVWDPNQWIIYRNSNNGITDADPSQWNNNDGDDVDCEFIITEIADPVTTPYGRFVEIYTPFCGGKRFPINTFLVHWDPNDDVDAPSDPIDLSKMTIPLDGFFVICATSDEDVNNIYVSGTCDYFPSSYNNAANNKGNEAVGIIVGLPTSSFDILDIYGVIGVDGFGTNQDFGDGRAVRKRNTDDGDNGGPSSVWNPNHWIVVPGADGNGSATVDDCDPGEWKDEVEPITPIVDDLVLLISEMATPYDNSANNFIELYSPNKRNAVIESVSLFPSFF
mmetsp:Transcript_7006/g.13211  ORF Transcript_7006/g.13211 Transcript_7006/m.13211 type:complete len:822 (-) Transcript_7006:796-3261(-)